MGICNFEDISYNRIGENGEPTQIEDYNMKIVQCKNEPIENFQSYKPYTGNLSNKFSSMTSIGSKISISNPALDDASCCYIYTLSGDTEIMKCNDFTYNISGTEISGSLFNINTLTISNGDYPGEFPNNGATINICAKSIGQTAQSMGSNMATAKHNITGRISSISKDGASMGGINGLVLLIISGLLSLFVYVLFMLGPFMFWTTFAPNTLIVGKNNCNRGRTILDRHFSHDKNELPYNWQKYDACRPPLKDKTIVIDKCMNETIADSLQSKLKIDRGDVLSKLDYLIKGWPYYLVDPMKERYYECYKGGPILILTIATLGCFFACFSQISKQLSGGNVLSLSPSALIENLFQILINVLAGGGLFYLISVIGMKKEQKRIIKAAILVVCVILLATLVAAIIGAEGNFGMIIGAVLCIFIFILLARLSGGYSTDGENYSFTMALVKFLYYIRRTFITGYRESNIKGNKYFSNFSKVLGKLPIPNWIWIIFGPMVIPFIIVCYVFVVFCPASWGGIFGFYDWVEPIINKKAKCYSSFDDNKKKKMTGGKGEDKGYNSEPGDDRIGGSGKISSTLKSLKTQSYNQLVNVQKEGKRAQERATAVGRLARDSVLPRWRAAKESKKAEGAEALDAVGLQKLRETAGGYATLPVGLILTVIPFIMGFTYAMFVTFKTLIKYFFIPLFYPKIIINIISCNIKSLIFIFVMGFLGIMWGQDNKSKYVPKEALIWMTVTFSIITLLNIIS